MGLLAPASRWPTPTPPARSSARSLACSVVRSFFGARRKWLQGSRGLGVEVSGVREPGGGAGRRGPHSGAGGRAGAAAPELGLPRAAASAPGRAPAGERRWRRPGCGGGVGPAVGVGGTGRGRPARPRRRRPDGRRSERRPGAPGRPADPWRRLWPAAVGRVGLAPPGEDRARDVSGTRLRSRAGSGRASSRRPRGRLVVTGATPARRRGAARRVGPGDRPTGRCGCPGGCVAFSRASGGVGARRPVVLSLVGPPVRPVPAFPRPWLSAGPPGGGRLSAWSLARGTGAGRAALGGRGAAAGLVAAEDTGAPPGCA